MSSRHRVLVADDSATARALLTSILNADARLTVVGQAVDGEDAVRQAVRLKPSIIVMDIQMPTMDGLEATRQIMADQPTPIVIVTAGHDSDLVAASLQAVRAGALTLLPKPTGPRSPSFGGDAAHMVRLVAALADVKVVRQRRRPATSSRPPAALPANDHHRSVDVVGIAASTGGPAALYQLLDRLPATVDVPILVVQHIADGFVHGLAKWLRTGSARAVHVATHASPARAGEVYLAPDDHHLGLTDGHICLSQASPIGGFRPSANTLFSSLAVTYGAAAVAVVLTGMGRDGLDGARKVRAAGGLVLAQDEATSAVYGMPGVVADDGLAHLVGPVDALAHKISMYAATKGRRR